MCDAGRSPPSRCDGPGYAGKAQVRPAAGVEPQRSRKTVGRKNRWRRVSRPPPSERREERAREAAATESGGAGTFRGTKKTRRSCRGGSGERRTVRKVACGRIRARFAHDFRIGSGASGPRMRNFRHTAGSPAVFRRGGDEERARCYFFAPARAAIRLTSDMNVLASEAPEMRPRSSPSEVNIR